MSKFQLATIGKISTGSVRMMDGNWIRKILHVSDYNYLHIQLYILFIYVLQGSPNCGPRAKCGPQKPNMRPATEYWPIEIFGSASIYTAVEILYYLSCGPRTSSYN